MLISILSFVIGLAGALLVAFGSWLVFAPAGYIVGGLLCLLWSYLAARSNAGPGVAPEQVRGDG